MSDPFEFQGYSVPHYMRESLTAYILTRRPVGGFLEAVISNDLSKAVGRADESNMANLPAYVGFLYNYAPSDCWGSQAKYEAWISGGESQ